MDPHLADYVYRYFGQFMTEKEHSAVLHLFGTAKATRGRSDLVSQEAAKSTQNPHLRKMLSSDTEVPELTKDGYQSFVTRTAERIWQLTQKRFL